MSYTLYQIRNTKTGRCYYGSTKNLRSRWNQHMCDLRNNEHHTTALQADYNAGDGDSFVYEILEEFEDKEDARSAETALLKGSNCYNTSKNANYALVPDELRAEWNARTRATWAARGWRYGVPKTVSAETRKRHSERMIQYYEDHPEAIARVSALGKSNSGQDRDMIKRAVVRSDGVEFKGAVDAARVMDPSDPERARARIKQALKRGGSTYGFTWGYKVAPPERKPLSAETRAKLAAASAKRKHYEKARPVRDRLTGKTWRTIQEASEEIGCSNVLIANYLRGVYEKRIPAILRSYELEYGATPNVDDNNVARR